MGSPFRRSGRATLKDWRDERGESSQTERSTEERAERRNTPRLRSILFLKSDPYDQSGHLRVQIVTANTHLGDLVGSSYDDIVIGGVGNVLTACSSSQIIRSLSSYRIRTSTFELVVRCEVDMGGHAAQLMGARSKRR